MKQIFWLVWNPQGRAPTFRHDSEQSAIDEASRLATSLPSNEFFVLQASHHVKREQPVTITKLDEIPF